MLPSPWMREYLVALASAKLLLAPVMSFPETLVTLVWNKLSIHLSVAHSFFCTAICKWLSWLGGISGNMLLGLPCFTLYQLLSYYFICLSGMTPDLCTHRVRSELHPLSITAFKDIQWFQILCEVWLLLKNTLYSWGKDESQSVKSGLDKADEE